MTIGLNFRDTSGYDTDGAGETYVLATDNYPVTRGGWTFGWTAGSIFSSNRDNTLDARFAGMNFVLNGVQDSGVFRVDLPASGQRDIRLSMGDAGSAMSNSMFSLWDDTSLISRVGEFGTSSNTQFVDATGVARSPSTDWIANNAAVTRTFTSTTFLLKIGSSTASNSSRVTHLFVGDAIGGSTAISATIAASSTVSYSVKARRAQSFTAPCTSSASVSLKARRATVASVAASASESASLGARRAMRLTPAATSSVVVVANVRRVQVATAHALSTVAWVQNARRDVRQTSPATSSVSVTLGRLTAGNTISVSITALSAMVAQMNARRTMRLSPSVASAMQGEINARRALLAIFAPQSAMTVDLEGASVAADVSLGKYRAEHDAALVDVAAVRGFSSEHASALRDVFDAGG